MLLGRLVEGVVVAWGCKYLSDFDVDVDELRDRSLFVREVDFDGDITLRSLFIVLGGCVLWTENLLCGTPLQKDCRLSIEDVAILFAVTAAREGTFKLSHLCSHEVSCCL